LSARRPDAAALLVLAALPVLAYAPAVWEGVLLGPGDGVALHYPLKDAVWAAYRSGELPAWNSAIFSGTPLLASYRPGAFYPPVVAASLLPPFTAFQVLVLGSLSAAGALTFVYLRVLGAGAIGAYVAGLGFALGPYLVGHLGDTATLTAAPVLPLLLLAAELYLARPTARRAAGVAATLALLLLAGSPVAVRAGGALVAGRLALGHLVPAGRPRTALGRTALALAAGVLLAAPQLVPTLVAVRDAGAGGATGLASGHGGTLPGATGLVLRYVSHTPAPSLALAALPLVLTGAPAGLLALVAFACLALQWGRGPLAAPGALALVFDFALAGLAGLSLSAQWAARLGPLGRRLRAHFLFWTLASAAALSIAAAALGPLPQTLAGSVGVLALALILYFSLAGSADPLRAGVFLLPLSVSFALQPHGRQIWAGAPTATELQSGNATREATDRAMGRRRSERTLTLVRRWPRAHALDLAYANLAGPAGRRSANGYDPMVSRRDLLLYDGMSSGGTLPGAFLRTDPARLQVLGVRWVQVPVTALVAAPDRFGLGDTLDVVLEPGRPRFFPVPMTPATELRLASMLAESVGLPQDTVVAEVRVRLASGRALPLEVRAGRDTAEWAYDRPDVRGRVAHARANILESWPGVGGGFEGHRYYGVLALPGRYFVDGVRLEPARFPGRLILSRLGLFDSATGKTVPVSLEAGYVSDTAHLSEVAATPSVRLFEVPGTLGMARVVERLRRRESDEAVLAALRSPGLGGLDRRREALAVETDVEGLEIDAGAESSRAEVITLGNGRIDLRASGPGLLVVAESWDPGWTAAVDADPARIVRVNHAQMGIGLPAGAHRVTLRYRPRGFTVGLVLALGAALVLLRALTRGEAPATPG
jgi:Bacterial membrane protein YfhO